MERRAFLTRTGLTFAAAALASTWPSTSTARQVDDWDAVRALFSVDPRYLHFGGLYLAAHPAPVREAIEAHRRGLDENPVDYLHQQRAPIDAVRALA